MAGDEDFYTVEVRCSNCGHRCDLRIGKGFEVPAPGFEGSECPNCGCRTLEKVEGR